MNAVTAAKFIYSRVVNNKPTITGSAPGVNDARVGGISRPWAEIPLINSTFEDIMRSGIKGLVTAGAVQFVEQNYLSSATNDLGWEVPATGELLLLKVTAKIASGVGPPGDVYAVLVNGAPAGTPAPMTVSLVGAALKATDNLNRVPVLAGDIVSLRLTSQALSVSANVVASIVYRQSGAFATGGSLYGNHAMIVNEGN
jgi:hypothetical protein